jgi:hypothetical protein
MRALFHLFLDICLFRKGPQHIPVSQILLRATLVAYGISGLLVLLISLEPARALLVMLADIVLLTGLTYGVLNLSNYSGRFLQTLTALLGTGTLVQLMALPVSLWLGKPLEQETIAVLPQLLYIALLVWSIAIIAYILQQALAVSRSLGILYTFGYIAISWTVSSWLELLV